MGSRMTGILLCGLLGIVASPSTAEGGDWSLDYVLQTTTAGGSRTLGPHNRSRSDTFIEAMSRPFASLSMLRGGDVSVPEYDFRRPDPEFGVPKAFRRAGQLRIGFSIRF